MALLMFDIASTLSDCICLELKRPRPESEDPLAPGWEGDCCVHPGSAVAYERCCEGNAQAWVVAIDGQPTVSFPIPDEAGLSRCDDGHTYIQRYEVGALRCVCTFSDDTGAGCSCEVKEQDAINAMGDMVAILRALECCFNSDQLADNPCADRDWRLQEYHLTPPEGGCVAAVATIIVELPAPCCLGA